MNKMIKSSFQISNKNSFKYGSIGECLLHEIYVLLNNNKL